MFLLAKITLKEPLQLYNLPISRNIVACAYPFYFCLFGFVLESNKSTECRPGLLGI